MIRKVLMLIRCLDKNDPSLYLLSDKGNSSSSDKPTSIGRPMTKEKDAGVAGLWWQ